jgi:hypothetical protein
MPLQNRVTPSGDIIADPHRGLFTGNRGIIHDPESKTLLAKRWASKAWLICVCDFKGRRRDVMGTRSWTELFFLDEATALAAGHRPCFLCRRADADAFVAAWEHGNRIIDARAGWIDAVLHRERLDRRSKRLHPLPGGLEDPPDGAMVRVGNDDYLMLRGRSLRWSGGGYRRADAVSWRDAALLTPPSTVRALLSGYRPVLHPSATVDVA